MTLKRELREEARMLRANGCSITDIAARLGIAKSTASVWVRDVTLTEEQQTELLNHSLQNLSQSRGTAANKAKHFELRKSYQQQGREHARQNSNQLHMMGCMLYWAEGAKTRNCLNFVNSDSHMMKFYMRFLREGLGIANDQIIIHIICHTKDPNEVNRIERYWLDCLQLPDSSLRKTTFKKGSDKRHNVLVNGVCSIRIYSTQLVQQVFGAIQEYGGFEQPEWLY